MQLALMRNAPAAMRRFYTTQQERDRHWPGGPVYSEYINVKQQ
jgi:hypothetical protein